MVDGIGARSISARKYCSPGPNAIEPFFELKFARMEYLANERYNLAFMRYTGQWCEIGANLSLDECLHEIKFDPWFQL